MVKKMWLSPPDREGFCEVSYSNPNEPERSARSRVGNNTGLPQLSWDAYRNDPMSRYAYDYALYCKVWHRRLSKDPATSNLSYSERDALIRARWNPDAMPTILRKEGSGPTVAVARANVQVNRQKGKSAAELNKVERNAEEGNLKTRAFTRDFIELVRTARVQRDMSQGDLAKEVNVLEGDIKRFEKGELMYDGALKSLLTWKLGLA